MHRALALARRGSLKVSPNPMVGAVIVKNSHIIGKGYHKSYGGNHAEVEAINSVKDKEDLKGSTMYVTLEPCNHVGKTNPCVKSIIDAKISKVFISMLDPNKEVKGGGAKELEKGKVKVEIGCMEKESRELNHIWLYSLSHKVPFLLLKLGVSLDSKIAYSREKSSSVRLTNSRSLWQVQKLRKFYSNVLVGSNTIKIDNARLNYRLSDSNLNPRAIIIDSNLSTSLSSLVYSKEFSREVIVIASKNVDKDRIKKFEENKIDLILVNSLNNKLDLKEAFKELYKRNIRGILSEGGSRLSSSLFKEKLVSRFLLYRAPKIIGEKGVNLFDFKFYNFNNRLDIKLLKNGRIKDDTFSLYDINYL